MKVREFTVSREDGFVLRAPALDLAPGGIYAVIGGNGSGKSTFLRALAGVLPTGAGEPPLPPETAVGYLPQKSYPFRLSAAANVALACPRDRARALALLEDLGMGHLARRRGDRLSGGEAARMALARVLAGRFDLLLLDEPTAALDMESTLLAERLILRCREETGAAVVLVTHSLPQARRLAGETLFFHRGALAEGGRTEELLQNPRSPETRRFLEFAGFVK